jgi:hypothetical protein
VEEVLRTPLADWDSIYFKIRVSPIGGDFTPASFLRTPISSIRWLLRRIDDYERGLLNAQSVSTAQLSALVLQIAHGFSGSKRPAPKANLRDFLPFPDFKPESASADEADAATRFVLSELVKSRRLPMHVYAALTAGAS